MPPSRGPAVGSRDRTVVTPNATIASGAHATRVTFSSDRPSTRWRQRRSRGRVRRQCAAEEERGDGASSAPAGRAGAQCSPRGLNGGRGAQTSTSRPILRRKQDTEREERVRDRRAQTPNPPAAALTRDDGRVAGRRCDDSGGRERGRVVLRRRLAAQGQVHGLEPRLGVAQPQLPVGVEAPHEDSAALCGAAAVRSVQGGRQGGQGPRHALERARTWLAPAATRVKGAYACSTSSAGAGTERKEQRPVPRAPVRPSPHVQISPSFVTAAVKRSPQAMRVIFVCSVAVTKRGRRCTQARWGPPRSSASLPPWPVWPSLPSPNVYTSPFSVSTAVCAEPQAAAVAFNSSSAPPTGLGVTDLRNNPAPPDPGPQSALAQFRYQFSHEFFRGGGDGARRGGGTDPVGFPCPNCPKEPSPQVKTAPSRVTTTV